MQTHPSFQTLNPVALLLGPIDYRGLCRSGGDALLAVDRRVLSDIFGAYERMHEAAGLGPMDWAGKLSPLAYAASSNPARLSGLKLETLGRVVGGLLRNADAEDRLRHWTESDHILRGARRIYLNDLKSQMQATVDRLDKFRHDLSAKGLREQAEGNGEMVRLSKLITLESIACGLIQTAVA